MDGRKNFSVVILAAGLSERMGQPKMFLKWNDLTFIERIVEGYFDFGCKEIIIVINERDKIEFEQLHLSGKGIKHVINNHIELGRFYSLQLGLSSLSKITRCFINNVDNPFVDISILSAMGLLIRNNNYIVPVYLKRKGHPVLISKEITEQILFEKDISINLSDFLKKYDCSLCTVDTEKILLNINTNEDFEEIIKTYRIK